MDWCGDAVSPIRPGPLAYVILVILPRSRRLDIWNFPFEALPTLIQIVNPQNHTHPAHFNSMRLLFDIALFGPWTSLSFSHLLPLTSTRTVMWIPFRLDPKQVRFQHFRVAARAVAASAWDPGRLSCMLQSRFEQRESLLYHALSPLWDPPYPPQSAQVSKK